ncbi:MAG: tRNA pseudouridine(55) synthase TruB, partial [Peptostreptococcaceae bacterium]|nr:tRNA pseudouridine(55) synthase TruB [Peptostreptococcaceae bacterium]
MNKIINILKPTGMTSHDVVSRVRRILNMKKVGHTGTLDPDASGVLPICIGKATKVSELILNKDKSYICELTLGMTTDTYDSSGSIIKRVDNFKASEVDIQKAFDTQKGEIEQLPPVYSALKINGKKMCDLARSGKADEIVIKARKVNIKEL